MKLFPIKWYRTIEKFAACDNYNEYMVAIHQPDYGWRPVTKKYFRQRSRFKTKA